MEGTTIDLSDIEKGSEHSLQRRVVASLSVSYLTVKKRFQGLMDYTHFFSFLSFSISRDSILNCVEVNHRGLQRMTGEISQGTDGIPIDER